MRRDARGLISEVPISAPHRAVEFSYVWLSRASLFTKARRIEKYRPSVRALKVRRDPRRYDSERLRLSPLILRFLWVAEKRAVGGA